MAKEHGLAAGARINGGHGGNMPFLHDKDEIGLLAQRAVKLTRNMPFQRDPMLLGYVASDLIGRFVDQGAHRQNGYHGRANAPAADAHRRGTTYIATHTTRIFSNILLSFIFNTMPRARVNIH